MKRLSLLLGILMLGATVASAQTATLPVLSIEEALALALAANRTVENATLAAEKANHDIAVARSRRFPLFSVEAGVSQLLKPVDITFAQGTFGSFPGIGPVPAVDTTMTTPSRPSMVLSASASQPLSQLPRLNLNVRLNEAVRDGDREQARAARLATVTEVKRLYYGILQTNSALRAIEYQARLLEELTRVVGNRVTQQVALKADSLDVETRLARVDVERLALRNTLASQKEQLNSLLGRDVRIDFDVTGVPEAATSAISLEAAQARAIAVRPDVAAARARLRQAELSHRLARAEYVPDVSLGVSYLSPVNIDGAPRVIATAGIQMEWEPFDWGRKAQTSAARAIGVRQAQNAVADAEARALIEVNSGFRKLDEARAKLRVARLAEETARENARMRLTQYSVQAALLTDTLQAQASLAESTHDSQQALLALVVARAEFDQAIGEDGTK